MSKQELLGQSKMGMWNGQLREHGHEELIEEEAVGGRLYTGPMYEKYNLVLRSMSGVAFLKKRWEQLCLGNMYAVGSLHGYLLLEHGT